MVKSKAGTYKGSSGNPSLALSVPCQDPHPERSVSSSGFSLGSSHSLVPEYTLGIGIGL